MVKNHWKNYQIRIRIFTKIELILQFHTPNVSTKFHPNPCTTFWDIMLHIVFGLISQWWRITKSMKNSRIRMWIRIFTKIESICHGHTPNLSTKFRPNPSTTFWDTMLLSFLAPSLNDEESLKQLLDPDPDLHQNWINSSSSHTELVHKISSGSVHNLLRHHAIHHFSPFSQWWRIT